MSYNTPVRFLQGGSVLEVASGGAINVLAGGVFSIGGTVGKWAFGTVGLTSGVGTIGVPGFTRVLSVNANPILGEAQGAGSAAFVFVDLSLSGAGSAIFRLGSVGGALWAANGTIAYQAFGT